MNRIIIPVGTEGMDITENQIDECICMFGDDFVNKLIKDVELPQHILIKYKNFINRVTLYNHQSLTRETMEEFGLFRMERVIKVLYKFGVHKRNIKMTEDGEIIIGCFRGTYEECIDAINKKYCHFDGDNGRIMHKRYIDGINELKCYYDSYIRKEAKC